MITRFTLATAALAGLCAAMPDGLQVHFQGLVQTPLGNADLAVTDSLVVSNIGSSGEDGVRAELGGADGWLAAVDFGPPGSLAPGMHFRLDAVGLLGEEGPASKPVCLIFSETSGGLAEVSVDTSFWNAGGLRVEALLDGAVVAQFDHTPPFGILFSGEIGSDGLGGIRLSNIGASSDIPSPGSEVEFVVFVYEGIVEPSFMPGGVVVATDEVRITLTGVPGGAGMPPIQALELRAAEVGQVTVLDEALGAFGNEHRGLGMATQSAGGGPYEITLSNIGSSGKDGVEVRRRDELVGSFGFSLEASASALPASLDISARLLDDLGTPANVSLQFLADPGLGVLSVDFSEIGAGTYAVQASLGGALLGSQSGLSGVVATMDPQEVPGCDIWQIMGNEVSEKTDWDAPTTMTINGLGTLTVDQLVITGETAPGPFGPLAGIELVRLTGTNLDELVITDESVGALPCPWDCDGSSDGVVNVVDLLAVLAQYDTANPPCDGGGSCDFDGSGCVDVLDLLKLLAHYDPAGVGCPE